MDKKQGYPLGLKITVAIIFGPTVLVILWAIIDGPSHRQANAEWQRTVTQYCASHTYWQYDREDDTIHRACVPAPLGTR